MPIIWCAETHYDQVREMLSQSHEFWRQGIAADHDILYISSEVSMAAPGTLCSAPSISNSMLSPQDVFSVDLCPPIMDWHDISHPSFTQGHHTAQVAACLPAVRGVLFFGIDWWAFDLGVADVT